MSPAFSQRNIYFQRNMKLILATLIKEEVVDLTGKDLGDGDIVILTNVPKRSKVLKQLRLSNSQLTLAKGKEFGKALAGNHTLEHLWLRNNQIGNAVARMLANALRKNRALRSVLITGNKIGHDGSTILGDALGDNKTLKSIFLNKNRINFDLFARK